MSKEKKDLQGGTKSGSCNAKEREMKESRIGQKTSERFVCYTNSVYRSPVGHDRTWAKRFSGLVVFQLSLNSVLCVLNTVFVQFKGPSMSPI